MTGIANTNQSVAPAPQPMKSAHRMLQRQTDGSLKSVLIDDNTGQPVSNPTGYNVTDGFFSDLSSLGLNPTNGVGATPATGANMPGQQTTAQKVISPSGSNGQDHSTNADRAGSRAAARDETNNFGYIDKPSAVGIAAAMPGAIGLAGKAVSLGINANNLAATNTARTELGLPDTTGMAAAKSVAMNNQGQVANIGIGNQNYSVGFNALSPTGVTNMTPEEARMHAALTQQPITELNPAQTVNQQAAFTASNPGATTAFSGPFSGILNGAKSFIDNIFLDPAQSFVSHAFNPNLNTFPDAPVDHSGGGYQGTTSGSDGNNSGTTTGNNANTNGQGNASKGSIGRSEGDGNFGGGGGMGLSPGAAGAIGAGGGGLY